MVGVCIKYYHENYGGVVQCFAFTEFLKNNGVEFQLIKYNKKNGLKGIIKNLPRIFNRILLKDKYEQFKKIIGLKRNKDYKANYLIRMNTIHNFQKHYFTNILEVNSYQELSKIAVKFDSFISGSDQLWSPAGLPTNFFNLMFVPDQIKKVSYASSFGVSNIPWYQKTRTKKFLLRFDNISVREEQGAKIINELIHKKVDIVVDPVFLLTKNEWELILGDKLIMSDSYIFAYFLGDNEIHRQEVIDFAKRKKIKIVTMPHLDQYIKKDEHFGDVQLYDVDPFDFLRLIRNANYICTDSFHGTAFSILFNKQFIVFDRYKKNSTTSKNSRIESICNMLDLTWRRFNGNNINILDEKIDYQDVNEKLDKLTSKSKKYLLDSLNRSRI